MLNHPTDVATERWQCFAGVQKTGSLAHYDLCASIDLKTAIHATVTQVERVVV